MAETPKTRPTYTADYVKGDWDKAVYHVDNLMTAFMSLGADFWALRRRVMVLEKFLAQSRTIDPAAVEAYEPTPEERKVWEAERDDYIDRVFAVLTRPTGEIPSAVPTAKVPPRKAS